MSLTELLSGEIASLLASVNSKEFFDGKVVHIPIITNEHGDIGAVFYAKDGTITFKGDFPRASSIKADMEKYLIEHGEEVCYQQACIQLVSRGVPMVLLDYPIAVEKHRKDLIEEENICADAED